MNSVDLRDVESQDTLTVTLENGETFTGVVSSREYITSDYSKSHMRCTFEGDFWDQINERVDDEVLRLWQDFSISDEIPKEAEVCGVVWEGKEAGIQEPTYTTLGEIKSVKIHD